VKYKYAVFDWDGTLADTFPVILSAYEYVFEQMKLNKISSDDLKMILSTVQNKDVLAQIFGERKNEASAYFYEYINAFHAKNLRPQPGAKELLDFCQRAGISSYLITNKKTKFINQELDLLGFGKYFKKVVAAGEYDEDKPHPVACRALFDNELPEAKEIVVIGDGEADVKTAEALNGADCIIYDPLHKYKGALPTYKIDFLNQAEKILEK
jgi:phosphoglycolate phosphatase/pyrophosphatase PpaX